MHDDSVMHTSGGAEGKYKYRKAKTDAVVAVHHQAGLQRADLTII